MGGKGRDVRQRFGLILIALVFVVASCRKSDRPEDVAGEEEESTTSFSIISRKTGRLYGPVDYREGAEVTIGQGLFTVEPVVSDARTSKLAETFHLKHKETGKVLGPFKHEEGAEIKLGQSLFGVVLASGNKTTHPAGTTHQKPAVAEQVEENQDSQEPKSDATATSEDIANKIMSFVTSAKLEYYNVAVDIITRTYANDADTVASLRRAATFPQHQPLGDNSCLNAMLSVKSCSLLTIVTLISDRNSALIKSLGEPDKIVGDCVWLPPRSAKSRGTELHGEWRHWAWLAVGVDSTGHFRALQIDAVAWRKARGRKRNERR